MWRHLPRCKYSPVFQASLEVSVSQSCSSRHHRLDLLLTKCAIGHLSLITLRYNQLLFIILYLSTHTHTRGPSCSYGLYSLLSIFPRNGIILILLGKNGRLFGQAPSLLYNLWHGFQQNGTSISMRSSQQLELGTYQMRDSSRSSL